MKISLVDLIWLLKLLFSCLLCLSGCCKPNLDWHSPQVDPSLTLLVEARDLSYTCGRDFLRSLAKHPRDGSKNGDVGHAWIYLTGVVNSEPFALEGGHSGELGLYQPKYIDGVVENISLGAKNPIAYLWSSQSDGFFQKGSGGHFPTYAVQLKLTKSQFQQICQFIASYDFVNYSLINHQCCTFVTQIAHIAGIELNCFLEIPIEPEMCIGSHTYKLWEDAQYSTLSFEAPELLELELMRLVAEGKAREVRYPANKFNNFFNTLARFPSRFQRYLMLK